MKRIILFIGIFLLLTSCQKPLKSWPCVRNNIANPMIHQQGKQIVNGQGDIIKLKGVNIGGWLLWEGWIWGSPLAIFSMDQQAEKNIGEKFTELLGKKEFENFQQQVYEHYIKESDIKQIKDLGFNLIRVPINHTVLQTDEGKIKEHGFQLLDRLLDWAEKYQVYVMLDLHSAPGGQFDFFVADPDEELLWDSPRKKQQTIDLWQTIAKRYAQRKIIAGYDLLNESVPPSPEDLIDIYQKIILAIRKVDQHHMIVIEGNNIAKEFWPFVQPFDNNQMYEFHIYNWFGDDRPQRLARLKEVAEKHCTPIWCGEFGENTVDMISSTREMFDNEQYIVGWAFWTWKKVPATQEGYPYLMGIHMPENWHKLIRWACRGDQKPSLTEAKKALQEFIDSLQKQGTFNSDMIAALRTH